MRSAGEALDFVPRQTLGLVGPGQAAVFRAPNSPVCGGEGRFTAARAVKVKAEDLDLGGRGRAATFPPHRSSASQRPLRVPTSILSGRLGSSVIWPAGESLRFPIGENRPATIMADAQLPAGGGKMTFRLLG